MENNIHPKLEEDQINQSNVQEEPNVLDVQTLENLAAFLSRDSNNPQPNINNQEANVNNQVQYHSEFEEGKQMDNQTSALASENNDRKNRSPTTSRSRSRSRSKETIKKRWIYCCSGCKKSGNKGKNCVCVVPATQRRIAINSEGCSVCSCSGCSKEDIQLKQDRKKNEESREKADNIEEMRNGCCKECMKAFSINGKACICQVPSSVRRRKLPDGGCLFCGCDGCNPEDKQKSMEKELRIIRDNKNANFIKRTSNRSRRRSRRSESNHSSYSRSRSRSSSRSRSRSRDSRGSEENLNNFDSSYIGNFLRNMFNIYPPLMGFGIPQRTYSYIYGKPPH